MTVPASCQPLLSTLRKEQQQAEQQQAEQQRTQQQRVRAVLEAESAIYDVRWLHANQAQTAHVQCGAAGKASGEWQSLWLALYRIVGLGRVLHGYYFTKPLPILGSHRRNESSHLLAADMPAGFNPW